MEFDQLKTVIAGILSLDPNEITEEETFVEDLGADSLDLFQIVMGIEEVFEIKIPPQEAEKITKVGEALALVHQMVEIKEQAAEHDNL
ncbi:MAG: acyl carrier protein [Lachnospiraceae bacterium]|nr:acyl carrier protein [Lachnospiraceae bacterium]